jgi:hypothetical protein
VDSAFDDTSFNYTPPLHKNSQTKTYYQDPVTRPQLKLISNLVDDIGENDAVVAEIKNAYEIHVFADLTKFQAIDVIKILLQLKKEKTRRF